jgi:subtilisin family serine protease
VFSGVLVVTAAGNEDADACNTSPASAEWGIDVGATTEQDARASYSNWGSCVEIFAPGDLILSAYVGNAYLYAWLSGTSMACPHVTGVALVEWREHNTSDVFTVRAQILEDATPDVLSDVGTDSPNLLLWADYQCSGDGNWTDFNDVIFDDSAPFDVLTVGVLAFLLLFGAVALMLYSQHDGGKKGEKIVTSNPQSGDVQQLGSTRYADYNTMN